MENETVVVDVADRQCILCFQDVPQDQIDAKLAAPKGDGKALHASPDYCLVSLRVASEENRAETLERLWSKLEEIIKGGLGSGGYGVVGDPIGSEDLSTVTQ